MISLRALGALLTYPQAELIEALREIHALLDGEKTLSREDRPRLAALIEELRASDLLDAQERYVELFDRGRATSLHLFEHVHGDSRERGQAMVDLKATYEKAGLRFAGNELPDYLPAVLEYLSLRPMGEVREMLADCAHILRAVGETLVRRGSRYGAVFSALLSVAGEEGLSAASGPREDREDDRGKLDEDWVDRPVLFGPGGGDARPDVQVVKFVRKAP
jgi:nitrate reductase delta subunit